MALRKIRSISNTKTENLQLSIVMQNFKEYRVKFYRDGENT
jgi:hypothetical protein